MPSVGELCELLEDLSGGPGVPAEALYARLNPWVGPEARAGYDREMLLVSLASLARRQGDPLLSHLSSLAIGYLGEKEGFHALVQLVSDSDLPATHRESAADALTKHYGDQLSPHTPVFDACMLLQTQRVLRLVAQGNGDARAVLESILENTSEHVGAREAIEPLLHATKMADIPLVNVWGDIVVAQTDAELRRDLITLIANDVRVESGEFLAALEGQTKDAVERKELRQHLQALRGHGVKVPAKAGKPRAPAAIAFGVDGDACASLFFFIPEKMGGTMVSFVIHLTSGIRDGFVREGLTWSDVQHDKSRFLEESDLAATIPFADGVRIIQRALAATPEGVMRSGDVTRAVQRLTPLFLPESDVAYPPPGDEPTVVQIRKLLDSAPFGYWFFEAVEATMAPSLQMLGEDLPLGAQPTDRSDLATRFNSAIDHFVAALVDTGERQRVSAMLQHQALVLGAAGKARDSAMCSRMALDLQEGRDTFLRAMAERSLLWGMNVADDEDDEWQRRYDPCHDGLKQVMQDAPGKVTKRQIARLDLGAQIATAIVMRNRRLPSAQRAGLHTLESAAFAMASAYLEKYDEPTATTPADLEEILHEHQILPEAERASLAQQALQATEEFVQRRCGSCVHQCLKFPGGAAEGLLFATDKPWDVPASAVVGQAHHKGGKVQPRLH